MERLADPHRWSGLADADENDPASMARMMRQLGPQFQEALGEDFPGEMDEMIEEAIESGEMGTGEETSGADD